MTYWELYFQMDGEAILQVWRLIPIKKLFLSNDSLKHLFESYLYVLSTSFWDILRSFHPLSLSLSAPASSTYRQESSHPSLVCKYWEPKVGAYQSSIAFLSNDWNYVLASIFCASSFPGIKVGRPPRVVTAILLYFEKHCHADTLLLCPVDLG